MAAVLLLLGLLRRRQQRQRWLLGGRCLVRQREGRVGGGLLLLAFEGVEGLFNGVVWCGRLIGRLVGSIFTITSIPHSMQTRTWIQCCRSLLLAVQSRYATLAPPPSTCAVRDRVWICT